VEVCKSQYNLLYVLHSRLVDLEHQEDKL